MNLVEFLSARLDEDARVATEVRPHEYLTTRDDASLGTADVGGYDTVAITSGRVLAEVDAKRRIVDLITFPSGGIREPSGPEQAAVVRIMAEVYVDHPDYREEWRP